MPKKIFSLEKKVEIVERYLREGTGLEKLANEYHVNYSELRKWKDAYLIHGIQGLTYDSKKYDGDFKWSVIQYRIRSRASKRQTAALFNISSTKTITKWEELYQTYGKDALYQENRGRAPKMNEKKEPKQEKTLTAVPFVSYEQESGGSEVSFYELVRMYETLSESISESGYEKSQKEPYVFEKR